MLIDYDKFQGLSPRLLQQSNARSSVFLMVIFSRPRNSGVIILVEAFLSNFYSDTSLETFDKKNDNKGTNSARNCANDPFLCVVLRNCNFLKYFVLQVIRDCCDL